MTRPIHTPQNLTATERLSPRRRGVSTIPERDTKTLFNFNGDNGDLNKGLFIAPLLNFIKELQGFKRSKIAQGLFLCFMCMSLGVVSSCSSSENSSSGGNSGVVSKDPEDSEKPEETICSAGKKEERDVSAQNKKEHRTCATDGKSWSYWSFKGCMVGYALAPDASGECSRVTRPCRDVSKALEDYEHCGAAHCFYLCFVQAMQVLLL